MENHAMENRNDLARWNLMSGEEHTSAMCLEIR